MKVAKVYVEHSTLLLDKPFSYYVPDNFNCVKGTRTNINFNGTDLVGYIEDIEDINKSKEEYENELGYSLKKIDNVIDEEPILDDELIDLAHYLANENIASLISCYQTILPPSLKPTSGEKTTEKYQKCIRKTGTFLDSLSDKIKVVYDSIESEKTLLRDIEDKYSVNKLKEKGIIEIFDKEVYRNPFIFDVEHKDKLKLTKDQQSVFNEINNSIDNVYLLEGVTGSGKTEIYLQLAEQVLNEGKNVLILVPEISLTPLMIKRVRERLTFPVAVLHSGLSNGEKYDEYRRIKRNEVRIVVGARSAVFAPLTNIGLIVIDEEHSESYKEENSPCYNAIDVAIYRSKTHKCKVILGGATPSIIDKTRAIKGIYHQLYLPNRINSLSLPNVNIVNMLDEIKRNNYSLLSKELKDSIKDALNNKEQVILLLNRRGYSNTLQCTSCGYVFKCEKCGNILHYHSATSSLKCHYCGSNIEKPNHCPRCYNKYIRYLGSGSQKLEEVISKEFPNARVLRMDLDSVSKKHDLEIKLEEFNNQQYDIMLGTQMISKGLDYPNVSLVGVINADALLYNGEFSSSEKTFQLLTQVVGRCGRGDKVGKAIIQTSSPSSYVITSSALQNYEDYYKKEMSYRKSMDYPPYKGFVSIILGFYNKDKLFYNISLLKEYIYKINRDPDLVIYGPNEAKTPVINKTYRYRLLIKYKDKELMKELLFKIKEEVVKKKMYAKFDTSPMDI